ncbi:MAG: M23 family metallopeptidase, partial [Oscillospiraceae bacterium]|nr:M23 family metallopeptidase [Oscillospiraceae bacterium]
EWTSDLVKFSEVIAPNAPETSSVLTAVSNAEDGRVCNVKAEIEMPRGNVGYGLVLSGFEDIPILVKDKAAEKFVDTLTNEEVKQAYQEKKEKYQEEAKSYPALPVSAEDMGTYGANNKNILFAVPKGTEVLASLDGTVKSAEKGFNHGYGFSIEISHGDGMSTFYAHLDDFAVEVGDEVKKGDVIGYSGSSGDTLGDALLFEIRKDGIAENPWNYYFFGADDYQRTLDEIGKDHVDEGVGIAGIYSEDGRLISETASEPVEIEGVTYYIISTEEQLRAIAAGEYGMDKNFLQNGNIYLSSDEWIPIGTKDDPFTGIYAGNGFEIIGLTMKDPDATMIGMFGYAENAEIYNITLRDYDIESAGSNAPQKSVAPILPIVTEGTRCYDNHVYPAESSSAE